MQLLCSLAVVGISILVALLGQPFEDKSMEQLEQMSLYAVFITLFLSIFFTYPHVSHGYKPSSDINVMVATRPLEDTAPPHHSPSLGVRVLSGGGAPSVSPPSP